jgi:phospholipid/cholesterol/gamma-HCH transport system substrate-binding protein
MCESDEQYVPLNDGYNWKGDPNATLSGQAVPQYPAGVTGSEGLPPAPPAPAAAAPQPLAPPMAAIPYDPATGDYVGPDGRRYTQADLGKADDKTWQSMLVPPGAP